MNYPNIIKVEPLLKHGHEVQANVEGKWVAARPLGYSTFRNRIRCAWLVFTGKGDVLLWEGQ